MFAMLSTQTLRARKKEARRMAKYPGAAPVDTTTSGLTCQEHAHDPKHAPQQAELAPAVRIGDHHERRGADVDAVLRLDGGKYHVAPIERRTKPEQLDPMPAARGKRENLHRAPFRKSTAGTVRKRIFRSSHNDQLST